VIAKVVDGQSRYRTPLDSFAICRTDLIDAFQATLQEAADASLLLHVVDASNDNYLEQMDEVYKGVG
jgi:hypothetical protein